MTPHEQMEERTRELEDAFYRLLDACDEYLQTAERLLAEEKAKDEPRAQLVHRLEQLSRNVGRISEILEDDALTILLPVLDRLFALKNAEVGKDI